MTFTLLFLLLVHPVHETFSEIEWNPKTKRLEVALRLDVLDEQWIKRQSSNVEPERNWQLNYLINKFRVTNPAERGQPATSIYHWVGRQEKGAHAWWYFEIEPADGNMPQWIQQRMLEKRESDYTHRIMVLAGSAKRSINLSTRKNKARLDQAKDDARNKATDS